MCNDKKNYYSYRSASEVESLLYVALDLEYITKTEFDKLKEKVSITKKLIGGFIKYLKSNSN